MPPTPDRGAGDSLAAAADAHTWNWEEPGTILGMGEATDAPGASDAFLSMPDEQVPVPSYGTHELFPVGGDYDEAFLPELESSEPGLYATEPQDAAAWPEAGESEPGPDAAAASQTQASASSDPLLMSLLMSSDVAGLIQEAKTVKLPPAPLPPADEPVVSWQQLEEMAAPRQEAPVGTDELDEPVAEAADVPAEETRRPWRAWAASLLVGLLGGVALTAGLYLAVGRGAAPPPENVAAYPTALATLPPAVTPAASVVPVPPKATPAPVASAPPVAIPALTDPASTRRQLRDRLDTGVRLGKQDPFVITAPFLLRPASRPIVPYNPVLVFPGAAPPAPGSAPAQEEVLELRLTGVMPGPRALALVEGAYQGRPFKVWAGPGQSLGYGLRVGAVGASSLEIRQARSRFTLALGTPVTLRRTVAP